MSSNGGEDAVDGTIEKKDEDALVESVKKVEISEDSKEVEKKASTEEPGHFHFTNRSPSIQYVHPDKAILKSHFSYY